MTFKVKCICDTNATRNINTTKNTKKTITYSNSVELTPFCEGTYYDLKNRPFRYSF